MSERGALTGSVIVKALNRALAHDDQARKRLRRMQGMQLGVEITGPDLRFILEVEDQSLKLADSEDGTISTWLKATPGGFMAVAASGGQMNAGRLQISGDAETGRQFQQLFQSMKPDFEEAMSRVFGDVVGVQLARAGRELGSWFRSAGDKLADTASDYARFEGNLVVDAAELDEFLDAVDDLRNEVDHLQRRVSTLLKRRGGEADS